MAFVHRKTAAYFPVAKQINREQRSKIEQKVIQPSVQIILDGTGHKKTLFGKGQRNKTLLTFDLFGDANIQSKIGYCTAVNFI